MRYLIEGTICKGALVNNWESFVLEIEADSPQTADTEAQRQILASRPDLLRLQPFSREIAIWDIQIMMEEPLDELGEWILQVISKKWLTENHHLAEFNYSPDTLSKPFGSSQGGGGPLFQYMHPGTSTWTKHIQTKFPQEIAPLIRMAVCNRREAEKAIELVFARIKVREESEADGDHHSSTYGEPVFVAYYLDADEAFKLASNTQGLRQLLRQLM
ncbi:MAG: hypothetical protein AB1643_02990 [Patescibacteria group bacterium]